MNRDRTDAMAEHRAWQQLRDLIGDRDEAEKVADHFVVTFERRINEHGVAVRRVVMYGPEEVDPLRNAKPAADAPPALFEIPAAA